MTHYQFSDAISLRRPKIGAPVQRAAWPRVGDPSYRYSGFGRLRSTGDNDYRYAGLGAAIGTDIAPTSADASAATRGLQSLISRVAPSVRSQLSVAGTYINLVLGAAQIGTGIASSACSGCDRTGIDVVNTIISWVRAILSGTTPTLPTMTPDQLRGFVDFCRIEPQIKGGVDAAFGIAIAAASAAGSRGDGAAAQAANALVTIGQFIDNLLDGICAIPQIQSAVLAASCIPNSHPTATGECECDAGYTSAIIPGQCILPPTAPTAPTADCVAAGEPNSGMTPIGCVCVAGTHLDLSQPPGSRCVPNPISFRPITTTSIRPLPGSPLPSGGGDDGSSSSGSSSGWIVAAIIATVVVGGAYAYSHSEK